MAGSWDWLAGTYRKNDHPPDYAPQDIPCLNGPIHTISQIINVIVSSAAEVDFVGNYLTAQEVVPIHTALI